MDTSSHELLDAQVSAMTQGEVSLATALTPSPERLTIFDRAYFSAAFLFDGHRRGENSHRLMRARDSLRHEVLASFGPDDSLMRMPVSLRARQLPPHLLENWQARVGSRFRLPVTDSVSSPRSVTPDARADSP